jgi:hypothetical protein
MNTRSSKEYRYIFTTTWKQASTSHLSSWLTMRAASSWLSYLIFSCCQLPFCEFPKNTTAFHYRYDIQMYCTFVHFVNQHFPGLPPSGTHCIKTSIFRSNYNGIILLWRALWYVWKLSRLGANLPNCPCLSVRLQLFALSSPLPTQQKNVQDGYRTPQRYQQPATLIEWVRIFQTYTRNRNRVFFIDVIISPCITESNKTTVHNVIFCVHSLLHQLTQHVSAPHGGHPQV